MTGIKSCIRKIIPQPIRLAAKEMRVSGTVKKILKEEIENYSPDKFPWGINLIGPIASATGLGQSFRLIERVVEHLNIAYVIYEYTQNTDNHSDVKQYASRMSSELPYGVNLWHVNPSEFADAYKHMGKHAFDGHYNIAFWLWELEEFPDEWVPYIRLLDEIWTPSEFISRSIRKKTDKPVYTIPYCVTAEADKERYGRGYFHIPKNQFLFLMMYDTQSIQERKNPVGVIRAFQKAFSPDRNDVGLVIKVNSADSIALMSIKKELRGYKNVYLIQENLEKIQVNSLIACVDVFVSLHRAEGFGLVLAEAMLNHIPTIATNWSANTEFMNKETACMVDCRIVTLEKTLPPYKRGSRWAEPDLEQAVGYMKRLAEDKRYYKKIADGAYQYVSDILGMQNISSKMKIRLQEIRDGR